MPEQKKPQKSVWNYYIIILLVALLLNALVFPKIMTPNIVSVDYGTFLTELDEGKIKVAEMDSGGTTIYYTHEEPVEDEKGNMTTGDATVYAAGVWPGDTSLADRLYEAGVRFSKVVPQQASPLVEFLITWVLPIALMILVMNIFMRAMQKRMGGNALALGKSNAKIGRAHV